MKIIYNETKRVLQINDDLKNHLFLSKFMAIVLIANAAINLYDINKITFGWITVIWLLLGLVASIFLFRTVAKRSGADPIPVDKIASLQEVVKSGRKKYFIKLTNGKTRDLMDIKTDTDFGKVKKLFKKHHITI
jgi:hypothetical protein